MNSKKLVVFGFGARGRIYADFANKYPELFTLVAIIENNPERIEDAKKDYKDVPVFSDYHDFLAKHVHADVVAVCTQDADHKEHAIAMMEAGYNLLLEKPIANNEEDCLKIYESSIKNNRRVIVCHVLRYSPFYSTIKRIIDEGKIGEVVSIQASENVGYYHQAHSFVRGPWKNSKESSPMILAKCCHDMDIIRWLIGEKCKSVNSYGSLLYFNKEHAPVGSSEYCSDCKYKDCIYNAQHLYLETDAKNFVGYFTNGEINDSNVLKCLRHSDYDRCVFKSDNDVVDHEVTIMNFANGKTASHTMSAFSKDIYRDIKIYATKAQLIGLMEDNHIEIKYFGGENEIVDVDISKANVGGHNGSDYFMMNSLFKTLNGEIAPGVTYLDVSLDSHLICFAAEKSRTNNGMTVFIGE
ncbi:MAG: Gfo/Idh/MocA family oxidoreductase [Bacilli bacterium]|nr:Gfo/Idh/MocA family oxidoreductase [Bacilli bacterium]